MSLNVDRGRSMDIAMTMIMATTIIAMVTAIFNLTMLKGMEFNCAYRAVRTMDIVVITTNTMKKILPTHVPMHCMFMGLLANTTKKDANESLMPLCRVQMTYKLKEMISSIMQRMIMLLNVVQIKRDGTSTYTLLTSMLWLIWHNRLWYSSLE